MTRRVGVLAAAGYPDDFVEYGYEQAGEAFEQMEEVRNALLAKYHHKG